ncbi:MAG: proteinase inhibitor, partial [Myxococcales bacterium]|nr:proteinase inhibitor [Myxococcales bacterium]
GAEGYTLVFSGDDPAACQATVVGCETFAGGTFTPAHVCGGDGGLSGVPSSEAFLFGEKVCTPPADGVPGQGPDGTVCTWDGMQGCTEEGRRFIDQASCATPWRQRGYYPVPIAANTPTDDPRLGDAAYMAEVRWVTAQVEACSCTCCHSTEATPNGPSLWFIEDGPIWTDAVSNNGLAMFAGFAPSETFGAYPAADNNGFSRDRTGLPTTDVERLQRFVRSELARRGVDDPEGQSWRPFGGPLVTQDEFEPELCGASEGIIDGAITWAGGGARYVYVLEADAANPGAPPNRFQPEGTLWQVMVDPVDAPFGPGFVYGEPPAGAAFQAVPAAGPPPTLVPGNTYYLYVLADIIRPLARCLFVYEG